MTPTPTAGDIWEWWHRDNDDYAIIILLRKDDMYWLGVNLISGELEDVSIHQYNSKYWRLLA